jgi:hypothetical protein
VTETPETSSTPFQVPGARPPWSFLMDMDGVLVHEEHIIPGADEFIAELTARGSNFVVVTNNPIYTRRDLRARLLATGLDIPEERIWTSALATAKFLHSQRPGGSAFVIGEVGLTTAMHEAGYVLTDRNPDYVVLGETSTYSFEAITTAIRPTQAGARFGGRRTAPAARRHHPHGSGPPARAARLARHPPHHLRSRRSTAPRLLRPRSAFDLLRSRRAPTRDRGLDQDHL